MEKEEKKEDYDGENNRKQKERRNELSCIGERKMGRKGKRNRGRKGRNWGNIENERKSNE